MSKRLIAVLVLAFVVGTAFAAYAEVQNVKVGGDYTAFGFSRHGMTFRKNGDQGRSEAEGLAQIANIKIAADLTDAVAVNMIVRNERVWGGSTATTGSGRLETYIAVAYVTLKDFIQEGWTFKIGQQAVKLGSGMIWGDPNTNRYTSGPFNYQIADFCPRVAFTGGLATMDYSPLKLTAGALKIAEDDLNTNGGDVNTYVLQAGYDLKDILDFKSMAEVYWVLEDPSKYQAAGFTTDWSTGDENVNVIGMRSVMSPADNLEVSGEYAYQTQKSTNRADGAHMSDNAIMLGATMGMPDVNWSPTFGVDYARFSRNWDPMYETLTPADIANLLFVNSNVQCIGLTIGLKPMDDLSSRIRFAYMRLVDDIATYTNEWTTYTMTSKKELGQELDMHWTYDYTADVQFKLMTGYFFPGDAFDGSNDKSASQVIGSMKVTF